MPGRSLLPVSVDQGIQCPLAECTPLRQAFRSLPGISRSTWRGEGPAGPVWWEACSQPGLGQLRTARNRAESSPGMGWRREFCSTARGPQLRGCPRRDPREVPKPHRASVSSSARYEGQTDHRLVLSSNVITVPACRRVVSNIGQYCHRGQSPFASGRIFLPAVGNLPVWLGIFQSG